MSQYEIISTVISILSALISVVGLLIIYNTLNLQVKLNQDQYEILRLELEKDRRSIKPFFQVESRNFRLDDFSQNGFAVTCQRNLAHFVLVRTVEPNVLNLQFTMDLYNIWNVNKTEVYWFERSAKKLGSFIDVITINFCDEDGRFYSQTVTSNGREVTISLPELSAQEKLD